MASLDSQPKDVAITNVFVALQIDNGERLTLAQRMGKEDFLAIEKKIRWKLDVRLLCMAWVMYFFNYLDRVNAPLLLVDPRYSMLTRDIECPRCCKGYRPAGRSGHQLSPI